MKGPLIARDARVAEYRPWLKRMAKKRKLLLEMWVQFIFGMRIPTIQLPYEILYEASFLVTWMAIHTTGAPFWFIHESNREGTPL
jgi:hypothetical protein